MNAPQSNNGQSEQLIRQADILIVDDIPDNIRFLSTFLIEQGYQVRKAINGQMALTAIKALVPDLILLDVNLPDMNGYEICRKLKEDSHTQEIPIVFLSAGNETIDKVKAFQMGAVDYITKPFYLEEVLARIKTQLTIQKLRQELTVQNQQLKSTLEELKIAQTHLVQQEKMATLRKVVAGVTHEINNPLSFITCNIKPTQDSIQHLLSLIKLYREKYSDPSIQAHLEEIDLEFLATDLPNILTSMKHGAERIHSVVLALRDFTHLDEAGIKQVNLLEGIENVLSLLQHRLTTRSDQGVIHVKKNYAEVPPVEGYADQLNQVFFNLLVNAIDAIEEKHLNQNRWDQTSEIAIEVRATDDNGVTIRIKDTGIGIPEAHQARIFEPFFTTKPAGQGVGLGLATSRRIIEELHKGSLTYRSAADGGTEFTIEIPLQGDG